MKFSPYTRRFFASTRGEITLLLREKSRTVTELAEKLSLTDNAVRAHLATLERDGLVRQKGERPGARKPHLSYELTAEAEEIFPKAYGTVLDGLLAVLKQRLGREETDAILRQVGQEVAASQGAVGDLAFSARLDRALKTIESIGGQAHVEEEGNKISICGTGCPLSAVTAHHPEVCGMLGEVLTQIIGTPVRHHCRYEPFPQCRFEVAGPPAR